MEKQDTGVETDAVYEFFARSKPSVRKRAYERALRAAQEDQLNILQRAEVLQ